MIYESFCGGIFETNCYLLRAPDGSILFDAPDGACEWLVSQNVELKLLLLTHGHFDHIPDAAKIKRRFECQIGCHPLTSPMISYPEFFLGFGIRAANEPFPEMNFRCETSYSRPWTIPLDAARVSPARQSRRRRNATISSRQAHV